MADGSGRIDLHMHSTVSDGTDTPEEILAIAIAEGIDVFSVTDHDDVRAGTVLKPLLKKGGPVLIPGVEFSCRDEEGRYHILGYGFDPEDPEILSTVGRGHALRMGKVHARLEYLQRELGFAFTEEEIGRLLAMDNPGKPHIGDMMVAHGYAATRSEAIRDFINKAPVPEAYLRPEEAVDGILKAGGIPVLAHPFFGSGDEMILGEEMEKRVRKLVGFGLKGLETFYFGFTEKLRSEALALADKFGLYVTAGSDYHGKNKMVLPGDTGLSGPESYPEPLIRFLEAVIR